MTDLLACTARLVDVPSVSHEEHALADLVEAELRSDDGLEVRRIGDNVVARTVGRGARRILLGGHLDTVPPNGNAGARVEGDRCFGCGAADMKGGIAVLLELAGHAADFTTDVTFVLYACEEVARADSGLLAIDASSPELLGCDAAILLEPTGGSVEAGCQGVLRVAIDVVGERAHAARPWNGTNAIHRLSELLARIASFPEREPLIDGCAFHETLQAVRVDGGIAGNVVPDHARLLVSHRFAPDRDVEAARLALDAYLAPALDFGRGDRITTEDAAPSAPPALKSPFLSALVDASRRPPRAKLGWTDVAFFAERAIPAANFGPGDPELAHQRGEFVTRAELNATYDALFALVSTVPARGGASQPLSPNGEGQ